MTGYQEVLSDPSYCGQILTFTYPLIGNYGVNGEDWESSDLRAQGMVCRDLCEVPEQLARPPARSTALLAEKGLPGLSGIDTRALTRHLRDQGTMRGCLSTLSTNADELVDKARKSPQAWKAWRSGRRGDVRRALLVGRRRRRRDASPWPTHDSRWWWCSTSASSTTSCAGCARRASACAWCRRARPRDVLALEPAGVLLSNGPAIPSRSTSRSRPRARWRDRVPTLGICLGHQLLGLAFGGEDAQAQVRPPRQPTTR